MESEHHIVNLAFKVQSSLFTQVIRHRYTHTHTHTHTLGETKVLCLDQDVGSELWGERTGSVCPIDIYYTQSTYMCYISAWHSIVLYIMWVHMCTLCLPVFVPHSSFSTSLSLSSPLLIQTLHHSWVRPHLTRQSLRGHSEMNHCLQCSVCTRCKYGWTYTALLCRNSELQSELHLAKVQAK